MKNAVCLFALLLGLAACAPVTPAPSSATAPTAETPSPIPLPSAIITPFPTPTEIPIPQGLENVPEGYSAVRNPDGTWGYGVGANAKTSIPDLMVDTTGAHFRLDGKAIDIAPADIPARIQVGQAGALQIYDYDKYGFYGIEYAWVADQNIWIKAADIRQSHRTDIPNYITVQTRAQLEALFNREELVMAPFPKDTYFPPLNKLSIDYWIYDEQRDKNSTADFNYFYPFGKVTDISKSPFRAVNFILLQKGEGRKFDTWIVTEQVFNPADGTFSLLHFGFDKYGEKPGFLDKGLSMLMMDTDPGEIMLPEYLYVPDNMIFDYKSCNDFSCNTANWLITNNYWNLTTDEFSQIKQMDQTWISTGKVPDELTHLLLLGVSNTRIMPKQ